MSRHAAPTEHRNLGRTLTAAGALAAAGAGAVAGAGAASAAPTPTTAQWDAIVHCESGGQNVKNATSSASGFFQILTSTWLGAGGGKYAPTAQGATFGQQLDIANKVYQAAGGFGPWTPSKACWAKLQAANTAPAVVAQALAAPVKPVKSIAPQTVTVHNDATPAAAGGAYTVQRGDTLSSIAKRLGVPLADLYSANRAVIGGNINLIRPGQLLTTAVSSGAHTAPAPTASTSHAAQVDNPLPTRTHFGSLFVAGVHLGTDLDAPLGTPIYAAFGGTVQAAGPANGFGNWIVITGVVDGQTVSAVYGHERTTGLLVRAGQQVRAGDQIGNVGDAGQVTGPHVHFEVWLGGRFAAGHPVDPQAWMRAHGVTL